MRSNSPLHTLISAKKIISQEHLSLSYRKYLCNIRFLCKIYKKNVIHFYYNWFRTLLQKRLLTCGPLVGEMIMCVTLRSLLDNNKNIDEI